MKSSFVIQVDGQHFRVAHDTILEGQCIAAELGLLSMPPGVHLIGRLPDPQADANH